MNQNAYDFSLFEENPTAAQSPAAPKLRAVAGGKPGTTSRQNHARNVWVVLMAAVMLALMILLLQSKATLTELNTQVREVQREITDAKSENNYLNSELGERTGMERIEDIAKQQGLMKIDDSQITYVRLEENSVITGGESEVSKVAAFFQSGLPSILDMLDP